MYQLGRTLRATRALLGLTQLEMSKRLSIHEDTLSNLERNLYVPSAGLLRRISEATGVSREGLLLINMNVPKELSKEYRELFDKVQAEMIKEFVSNRITIK